MLIVGNGRVITRDSKNPYLERGAVAIDGDTISAIGDEEELKAANPCYEYVDAHGGVIMPGLINCHTHIYSGLARGLAIEGCNPTNFLENLEQQWWKIDDNLTLDGTRASAYATILDSLRDGVTTIFDHHASFCEIPGSLFAIKDVAKELGMRSCLCYEVSDRRGEEKRDQSIAENAEFAKWAHDAREAGDNMIAAMFGGHATFTLSDETMDKMAEANDGHAPDSTSTSAEGMNDVWDSRLQPWRHARPVEPPAPATASSVRDDHARPLHPRRRPPRWTSFKRDRHHGSSTTRESNMGNAVGCAPGPRSSSVAASSVCMGTGRLHPRHAGEPEGLPDHPAPQRCHAQRGLGRGHDHAFREQRQDRATKYFGKPARHSQRPAPQPTSSSWTIKPFTPFSDENIDGHMLFGMMGKNCRTTIINGKVLYKDREFVAFDEERINAWTMEQSKKLWGDLNHRTY